MLNIIYLILGIAAGIASGLFGIGGGIVLVPALSLIFGFAMSEAIGTALAAMLLPVGIFAAREYYKQGYAKVKVAFTFSICMFFGVYFGSKLGIFLRQDIMKLIYGLFLISVSLKYFDIHLPHSRKNADKQTFFTRDEKIWRLIPLGLFTGLISGLFGVAGGIVMVPIMLIFLKFDPKTAVGTSLTALLLPTGLPGVINYYNAGHLNILIGAILAGGIIIGSYFGAKINIALNEKTAKKIFAFFLVIVAIDYLLTPLI